MADPHRRGARGQPNYGELEEALSKHNSSDLESGIDQASLTIDEHTNDAKLYLLRAKLSYKLLLIKHHQKVNERIKNCLGDCDQAIAIIERGIQRGDITTVKRQALQLGYLCCGRLKDVQKEKEFERRMSEMNIKYPIAKHVINQLLLISPDQLGQNRTYDLKETLFPKVSFIDVPLLEDVIRCYKERQTVCRNCFCNDLKLSRGYDPKGKCMQCHWEFKKLLVIPKSPMTVNFYKSEMIAIPPWPKSKPNELPFESCAKPTDKSQEHKRCLIMSRNSAVWYAHTVEELVIWTVERECGCSFEDFIRTYEPMQLVTTPPYQPSLVCTNIVDPHMAAVYYPPAAPVPFNQAGLGQSYPMVSPPSTNFFILPTTTTMPYSEGFISPPVSYSIPNAIQSSVSIPAPPQLSSEDMVETFKKFTCSSPPTSSEVTNDTVTSGNTVDNSTVSE